jgi:predicted MFS family arabinose efflux permease
MMLVAALPALQAVFLLLCVPESNRWRAAVANMTKCNPLREVFGPELRRNTFLGVIIASIALIGTWGSVQWLPLWADQMAALNPAAKADTNVLQGVGAIVGALIAPLIAVRFGRRRTYFLLCVVSLLTCGILFGVVREFGALFLFLVLAASAATASFYGWFPLYLPELFPTRVRATGQAVCFNAGRVLAAAGALFQGQLVAAFEGSYARAGAIAALVYLLGMAIIWLAPETEGRPLPD